MSGKKKMASPKLFFTDLIICSLESTYNSWTYYVEKLRRGGLFAAPFSLTAAYRPSVAARVYSVRWPEFHASASSTEKGLRPLVGSRANTLPGCSLARSLYFYFLYLPRAPDSSSSPRTRGDLLAKQISPLTRSKSHGSYAAIPSSFVRFNRI